jgi:membrane-bound ClpP family serine protease
MIPFILWALGLLLILFEFYLPGAVLGIGGGILIAFSIFLFASQSESPLFVVFYVIGVVLSIGFLIKFAMWRIRTQKPEKSIYSDASQDGFFASKFDKSAIGKTGIVLSDLKPGGYILIEGKQHQALSQTGYITKGAEVLVLSGQEESLLVKPIKKEQST